MPTTKHKKNYAERLSRIQSPYRVNVTSSSCVCFHVLVRTAAAYVKTVTWSDLEAALVQVFKLMFQKSGDANPAQMDKTSALVLLLWAFFAQAEDTKWRGAAVRGPTAHSVGWGSGCRLFQRKVRATYLRSPPCWKKRTSISVSKRAVT